MTLRPCLDCGELAEATRCPEHLLPDRRGTATARGYDATWHRLSKRARKLQPFCSDCRTTEDLTTDHSAKAWARRAAGKSIRLRDVDVVCRSCNAKRGKARGGEPAEARFRPSLKAKFVNENASQQGVSA